MLLAKMYYSERTPGKSEQNGAQVQCGETRGSQGPFPDEVMQDTLTPLTVSGDDM